MVISRRILKFACTMAVFLQALQRDNLMCHFFLIQWGGGLFYNRFKPLFILPLYSWYLIFLWSPQDTWSPLHLTALFFWLLSGGCFSFSHTYMLVSSGFLFAARPVSSPWTFQWVSPLHPLLPETLIPALSTWLRVHRWPFTIHVCTNL